MRAQGLARICVHLGTNINASALCVSVWGRLLLQISIDTQTAVRGLA